MISEVFSNLSDSVIPREAARPGTAAAFLGVVFSEASVRGRKEGRRGITATGWKQREDEALSLSEAVRVEGPVG